MLHLTHTSVVTSHKPQLFPCLVLRVQLIAWAWSYAKTINAKRTLMMQTQNECCFYCDVSTSFNLRETFVQKVSQFYAPFCTIINKCTLSTLPNIQLEPMLDRQGVQRKLRTPLSI